MQSATIQFGLTTNYGTSAPVDLTAANYRTLLLGMKPARLYHYAIVASSASSQCTSQDYTIETGPLTNGLPIIAVSTGDASAVNGGFLVTGQYLTLFGRSADGGIGIGGFGGGGGPLAAAPAYILDADGEIVWWYMFPTNVTSARMTRDGKYMWLSSINVPEGTAVTHRVSMDGLVDEDHSQEFASLNHELTVLPDETVVFCAYNDLVSCDDIRERAPDGTVRTVVNIQTAEGITGPCHCNMVQYSKFDDTYVFSDLDHNSITKISRTGQTIWVLNGPNSNFSGDTWVGGQHGIDVLGLDQFLIFNNNSQSIGAGEFGDSGAGTGPATAIEMQLDLTANTVKDVWSYVASPSITDPVMGDVKRLPNGNTLVAYSVSGILREIDPSGNVVQNMSWPLGASFGYVEKRTSLYGPPDE